MSQNIFPEKLQVTFCIDYYYKEYTSKVAQLFFIKFSVSLYLRSSNFTNVFLLNHVNFFSKMCVILYISLIQLSFSNCFSTMQIPSTSFVNKYLQNRSPFKEVTAIC